MKISYDSKVDALYILFEEGTVTTRQVTEGVSVDFDARGKIAGIEILDAKKKFGDTSTLRRVTLEDIGLNAA